MIILKGIAAVILLIAALVMIDFKNNKNDK